MRSGLNCRLSYVNGGTTNTYQVRAGDIGYGMDLVSAEDQGRINRAFYPHKTAAQRFSVQVLLANWDERTDFTNWLTTYAQWALDPNVARATFPFMRVAVSARAFSQVGLPLTGWEWGLHTGMMMFTPTFVFETGVSPGQRPGASIATSSVVNQWAAFGSDPAIKYFYPFGTQLAASQVPQDYGQVVPPAPQAPTPPYAPGHGPPPNFTGTG
ncbi:MAG: hypothetical protein JWM19_1002 [Actinomycetia bacterium]|nr:hypothetical protein [Actinomycetes bacterium]